MMAFSFGPFIGFWTASDALVRRGALVIPGGGMTSETQTQNDPRTSMHDRLLHAHLCIALAFGRRPDGGPANRTAAVRCLIVAGEPGGSTPAVRQRMEQGWGAVGGGPQRSQ